LFNSKSVFLKHKKEQKEQKEQKKTKVPKARAFGEAKLCYDARTSLHGFALHRFV
jgi:hypothetical protein